MKKAIIILIISLSTCAALFAQEQAYEYKPLVEPGKTWWYEAHRYIREEKRYAQVAFGIRLSEIVNIDGVEWHACRIVEPERRNETLDPIIAYLRQDGTRVLYRPEQMSGFENNTYNEILRYAYQYYIDPAHIPAEGILVCDFAAEKGSIMEILGCSQNMWDENGNLVYGFYYSKSMVYDVNYITNTGIQRKHILCYDLYFWNYIDGIGETGSNYSSLFFAPRFFTPGGEDARTWWFMTLQGVVDADENLLWAADESIVHPWELAGADDAVTDRTTWSYADGEIRCAADATIRVLDTTGRETLAPVRVAAGGTLKPALDSGIYILEVTTDAGRDVRKIAR